MDLKSFSDNQKRVIKHSFSGKTSVFAGGAVRSGKTYSVMYAFLLWIMRENKGYNYAIIGQSIETIMRNIGFDLIDTANKLGVPAKLTKDVGTKIIFPINNINHKIWIVGAQDAKARKRIQGSTLKGLVIEELPLLPKDFFYMAWSRLSVKGAKMFASYNPEGPAHWAKKLIIDNPDDFDGEVINFLMDDNPSLEQSIKDRYDRSFHGHFKDRFIKGIWAGATGLIFPKWELCDDKPIEGGKWAIGFDWGQSSVFCAVAFSYHKNNAKAIYELYYDANETGKVLTTGQILHKIVSWWDEVVGLKNTLMIIDPSTPVVFKRMLRRGGFKVRNGDNDVIKGITATSTRLALGEVKICAKNCTKLAEQMSGYVWDSKRAEVGEDVPTKDNDHTCDALRYFAHTTGRINRIMKPTKVREIIFN